MSDSKVGFHCKDVNSNWLGCLITGFPPYMVTEVSGDSRKVETLVCSYCWHFIWYEYNSAGMNVFVEMLIKSLRTGGLNLLAHEIIVATEKSW